MIDVSKLIIGVQRTEGENEINLKYLATLSKKERVVIKLTETTDFKPFTLFIFIRSKSFFWIKNLSFKTKLYPSQYKKIIKNLKLTCNSKNIYS